MTIERNCAAIPESRDDRLASMRRLRAFVHFYFLCNAGRNASDRSIVYNRADSVYIECS